MPGVWSQRTVASLSSSAGHVFAGLPTRRQWAIVLDGHYFNGAAADVALVRLNGLSTAIYRHGINKTTEGGTPAGGVANVSGLGLTQAADGSTHQAIARLTKGPAYWTWLSMQSRVFESSGAIEAQWWHGRASLAADISSIGVHFDIGTALARFTGQVSLWSTDD